MRALHILVALNIPGVNAKQRGQRPLRRQTLVADTQTARHISAPFQFECPLGQ